MAVDPERPLAGARICAVLHSAVALTLPNPCGAIVSAANPGRDSNRWVRCFFHVLRRLCKAAYAAILCSLSAPRMTIFSASFGKRRRTAFASQGRLHRSANSPAKASEMTRARSYKLGTRLRMPADYARAE